MPSPQEICTVIAGGSEYKFWKEVEIVRDLNNWVSTATLVVAEISGSGAQGWASVRLPPGVPAQVALAGQLVISGFIGVRQVSYDGNNHAVRFTIQSKVADLVKATLDMPPGQFKNQTLQQLASAAAGKFGVSFALKSAVDGAEKVFERVSIHMGESPFQFINRLAQMRNVHIFDNEQGNLVGIRGGGGSAGELTEGVNILSAEMVWSTDTTVDKFAADADLHGNDAHWSDKARATGAEATNPNPSKPGMAQIIQRIIAPMPGDTKDAQMFANHAVDLNAAVDFYVNVTVRGWQRNGGNVWLKEVGNLITLNSPMLLPQNSAELGIQMVTCRQSDATGTTSTLNLVRPTRLGGGDRFSPDADAPSSPGDAKPKSEDT
jgi:prophage tail gpP-like protein